MKNLLLFSIGIFSLVSLGCRRIMPVKKPMLYLYPETEDTIRVQVKPSGYFTVTYPEYKNEWKVLANHDGTLTDLNTQKQYYGLYWEGASTEAFHYNRNEGFVIEASNTANFLDSVLTVAGLSFRERNELIVYWLPEMQKNSFNYIHFLQQEKYSQIATHTIDPKPDTFIRLFMLWEPASKNRIVSPQEIQAVQRKGYTAVEWGGTNLAPRF